MTERRVICRGYWKRHVWMWDSNKRLRYCTRCGFIDEDSKADAKGGAIESSEVNEELFDVQSTPSQGLQQKTKDIVNGLVQSMNQSQLDELLFEAQRISGKLHAEQGLPKDDVQRVEDKERD